MRIHNSNTSVVGKTLAYTSIQFTNSKGEVAARGSHTKSVSAPNSSDFKAKQAHDRYVALAWKEPKNIVEELSPRP